MSKLILFGDTALELYAHLAARPSDSIAFRGKPPAETAPTTAGITYLTQLFPWLTQPAHVLVFDPDDRRQKLARCHVAPKSAAKSPLYRVANGIFAPSPELALIQASRGKRIEEVAALGTSLCSAFCLAEDSSTLLARTPLTLPTDIAKVSDGHRDVPGCTHVRSALHWMLAKAASPRECSLGLVLHLPPRFGGYGLPQPLLKEPIDLA